MAKKNLIGAKRAAEMTGIEIFSAVFKGASPSEYRGLSDAFSLEGIQTIAGRIGDPDRDVSRYAADAMYYLDGLED